MAQKGMKDVIVIGGGIHGLTTAVVLADCGTNITLLDKNQGLFKGTSGSTHNRAHMGYHYPRSIETAHECLKGLEYFKKKYPEALFYPKKGYYIIEKSSQTTKDEYIKFCDEMKIPAKIEWPSADFLLRDEIIAPFLVTEPVFNTELLYRLLEKEALDKGVIIKTGSEVIKSKFKANNGYDITTKEGSEEVHYTANIVVNATYAYTNNIMKIFGLEEDMTKYRLQTTEVFVVRTELPIPPLTIMDGPFMSIVPYVGHENHFLFYDVVNSILEEYEGYFYDDSKDFPSNWLKVKEKGKKYFPFMEKLEYAHSLRGSRPIPVKSEVQSRKTRLKRFESKHGFYSFLEGKFISAPLIAQKLKEMLIEDGLIS